MAILIFYIIFGGFLFASFYWYFRIFLSYKWMVKNKKIFLENNPPSHVKKSVYVLIPVLDETKRIKKTVDYFLNTFKHIQNLNIVLISTEKEFELFDKKTKLFLRELEHIDNTEQIIKFINSKTGVDIFLNNNDNNISKSNIETLIKNRENTIEVIKKISESNRGVKAYHYPYRDGNMASQLNYAINAIIDQNDCIDAIFCVYNADSKPHPKTFDWVLCALEKSNVKVFQQYGNYLKNLENFKSAFGGRMLVVAALWQTRWSIGFEIYNALRQLKFRDKKLSLNYPLNYCIGHGLFFTKDIYQSLGGFNDQTYNEDAVMGLELSYLGELIMPIPYLDESETPDSIISLYKQKSSWFLGPLQSFYYYREIVNKRRLRGKIERARLFILSLKLFFHSVYWVLGPSFMAVSFIIAIYVKNLSLWIVFACEVILFLSIPNMVSWFVVDNSKKQNKLMDLILNSFYGALPFYLLHGLSAYRALSMTLVAKLFNRRVVKEKTEMV